MTDRAVVTTPYPTRWFPDATTPADATKFDVHPERPQTADFRLPPALTPVNVMGRVVDQQGSGRAGVMVQLRDEDDLHGRESYPEPVDTVVTDASGRFSVTGSRARCRFFIIGAFEQR